MRGSRLPVVARPRANRLCARTQTHTRISAAATGLDGPEPPGLEGGLWIEQPRKISRSTGSFESARWAPLKPSDVEALGKVFQACAKPLKGCLKTKDLATALAMAAQREPGSKGAVSNLDAEGYLDTRVVAGAREKFLST